MASESCKMREIVLKDDTVSAEACAFIVFAYDRAIVFSVESLYIFDENFILDRANKILKIINITSKHK